MFINIWYFALCFVVISARPHEPQCSQFDFAEKTLERVIRFEHNSEINNRKIKEMEEKMDKKLDEIEKKIQNILDEKETVLNEMIRDIENNLKSNEEFREDISRSWTQYKTENSEMLANLTKEITDQVKTPTILFKAKDASVLSLSNEDVIVFPTDVMNEGGAYNNKTGVFTAPVNGVYMFSTQFCIWKDKALSIKIIAKDKVISASYYMQDYYSAMCYAANSVTVLEQGDDVTIKIRDKSSGNVIRQDNSYDYYWTSFSGVLIHR